MKRIVFLAALTGLTGCQTAPSSPMEQALNRAAGSDVIKQNCRVDYQTAQKLKEDKDQNLLAAKEMGATKSDYEAAYNRVNGRAVTGIVLAGSYATCNSLISNLAWGNSDTSVELPD